MSHMLKTKSYKIFFVCLIFVALGIVIFAYREPVGKYVWEKYQWDRIALALNANDAEMFFNMGNFYFGGGGKYDLERAEKYFKKTISLDAGLQGAHYQLGRVYFIGGDFYNAIKNIKKEIELYPDFAKSYYMKGLIEGFRFSGNLGVAAESFKKYIELNPVTWAGWNDLSWIYFKSGDYKSAAEAAENGLEIAEDNVWLLNSLGVSLLNLGKKKQAKEALAKAFNISGNMRPEDWGKAYPGNNPNIYAEGLRQMREAIEYNLELAGSPVDNLSGGKEN